MSMRARLFAVIWITLGAAACGGSSPTGPQGMPDDDMDDMMEVTYLE